MKTKIKYYTKNGDNFCGYVKSDKEAQNALRKAGYKKCYVGRDYLYNDVTYVGINNNNTVGVKQRRENGLVGATEIEL